MKNKLIGLFVVSSLMFLVLASFGSATYLKIKNTTVVPNTIIAGNSIIFSLNVSYTGTNSENLSLVHSTINKGSWVLPNLGAFNNNYSVVNINLTTSKEDSGIMNVLFNLTDDSHTSATLPFSINILHSSLKLSVVNDFSNFKNATIEITNNGTMNLTNVHLVQTTTFNFNTNETSFNLSAGKSKEIEISSSDFFNLRFGQTKNMDVKAVSNEADSNGVVLNSDSAASFCNSVKNPADLTLDSLNFEVTKGFGDRDNYWYPLDQVEVTTRIRNEGNYNIRNINLKACLFNLQTKRCDLDEGDMNLSDNSFDLNNGDSQDITLDFKVNPKYINQQDSNYVFYLSAEGEVDNYGGLYDQNDSCVSDSRNGITVRTDDRFIILNNFDFPSVINAGNTIPITANVWNVYRDSIDQDKIFIGVYSSELGINKMINFQRINSLDFEPLYVNVKIPSDAVGKIYPLTFTVYTENVTADSKVYEDSNGDKAEWTVLLNVKNPYLNLAKADISATLNSSAIAGQHIKVMVGIKNTGINTKTYNVELSGASWTSSVNLDKKDFTLTRGESTNIQITLNTSQELIGGNKKFYINVYSNGTLVNSKSVSLFIKGKESSASWFFDKINNHPYEFGFGLLNVLLVIMILFIAVRISRK